MSYLYAVRMLIPGMGRPRPIKIGFSTNPTERIQSYNCGPYPVELIGTWRGTRADEKAMHEQFKDIRLEGEWFSTTKELLEAIDLKINEESRVEVAMEIVASERKSETETRGDILRRVVGGDHLRLLPTSFFADTPLDGAV